MKKTVQMMLLCVIALAGFSSCTREVTYTLTNKTGYSAKAFIYEYNEQNERINVVNVVFLDNETRAFVANKDAVKIKIYIPELEAWIQQVFYLEDDISITIDGRTIIGSEEP